MTVGCLIKVDADHKVIERQPCWPWPAPDHYPVSSPSSTTYFFPVGYWRFRLGDILEPSEIECLALQEY